MECKNENCKNEAKLEVTQSNNTIKMYCCYDCEEDLRFLAWMKGVDLTTQEI